MSPLVLKITLELTWHQNIIDEFLPTIRKIYTMLISNLATHTHIPILHLHHSINSEYLPSTRKSDNNNNTVNDRLHTTYTTAVATCSRHCCWCWWTCWAGVEHGAVSQCEGRAPQPARPAPPGRSGPHTSTATTPHTLSPGEEQHDLLSDVNFDTHFAVIKSKPGFG